MTQKLRSTISLMLLFTMGCYQFVPASTDVAPPLGQDVRVQVTEEGAQRLQLARIFPDTPRTIEGQVVLSEGNAFEVLAAVRDPAQEGFRQRDLQQRIRIRIGEIERVDFRQMNRGRTALGIVGGLTAVLVLVVKGFGGSVGGDTTPLPPEKEN